MAGTMEPRFFSTPEDFRAWLEEHHESETVLWVGFYKVATGRASITWPESVDEALCFGWIDGLRKKVDEESYMIRFTPRKPDSNWSAKNLSRIEELIDEGRVRPAGLEIYEARDPDRSKVYSFERRKAAKLDTEQEARFRAHEAAWSFFRDQPPWYRRAAIHWVISAKREQTRTRRLDTLIEDSAAERWIGPLRRPGGR
jgi:uncharacterized protein YdeI (YjbR/CyaY-like superfamily)